MAYKEYKVVHIAEGGCGTIFLGSSGLPLKKIELELNSYASEGYLRRKGFGCFGVEKQLSLL